MQQNNRPIDSAVQPCAQVKHAFDLFLGPAPDATPRPAWWPVDKGLGYGDERLVITLGGVPPQQQLDGGGFFHASDIPPGVAKVQFTEFYASVRADLERRTRYAGAGAVAPTMR
jgi:hypothetical protein